VYVTHDQEEALTMSDRIALMRAGRIEQVGTPREIYERPATRYAADFIGETNLFAARVRTVAAGRLMLEIDGQALEAAAPSGPVAPGQEIWLSVRPEVMAIVDAPPPAGYNSLEGTVEEGIYAGSLTKLRLRLAGGATLVLHLAPTGAARAAGAPARVAWPADRAVCLVA
jgi:spermidine/putrescine transport system ATP-binding protein